MLLTAAIACGETPAKGTQNLRSAGDILEQGETKRERGGSRSRTRERRGTRGVFPPSRTCQERGEEGPGTVPSRAEVRSNRAMAA